MRHYLCLASTLRQKQEERQGAIRKSAAYALGLDSKQVVSRSHCTQEMLPFQRSRVIKIQYTTACELSVTILPHLSDICFIDNHEILLQGLPLRFSTKQLVQKKSWALYISLLISMVPKTAVLWSYGVEFLPIVWQTSFNHQYFLRIEKIIIKYRSESIGCFHFDYTIFP